MVSRGKRKKGKKMRREDCFENIYIRLSFLITILLRRNKREKVPESD
jgi:hypothetical protein